MIYDKHVINSLPLVAAVLSQKYGVEVHIGGTKAFTDGKTIQLPSLPAYGDSTLLGLARGYIDHESAHIRDTDFEIAQQMALTPLENYLCNIFEDWRVEKKLAGIFPGCARNFAWLIRHFILENAKEIPAPIHAQTVLNWILLTVCQWTVKELAEKQEPVTQTVEAAYPGLIAKLNPILQKVPLCLNTADCASVAQEVSALLRQYCQDSTARREMKLQNQKTDTKIPLAGARAIKQLQSLLEAGCKKIPQSIGEQVAVALCSGFPGSNQNQKITVAIPANKYTWNFNQNEIGGTRQASNALRIRLQALMQSKTLKHAKHGYTGKLDTHKLHAALVSNPKVFRQKSIRQGLIPLFTSCLIHPAP